MALVRSSRGRRRMMAEINVVPYVDVMLVLVVILMVAAPFVNPSVVNLPTVGKADQVKAPPIRVVVRSSGKISVFDAANKSERPVEKAQLVDAVRERQAGDVNVPVVIEADKDVRYESVVQVMAELQKKGIARVGLSVRLSN